MCVNKGYPMNLSNFTVGKEYEAKKRDFEPPDGSPAVQGTSIRFTVLEPADAANHKGIGGECATPAEVAGWAGFLRVRNQGIGRVHLLHPTSIESARELVERG